MDNIETKIQGLITDLRNEHGFLPKFAHNLYKDDNYVYYAGPYFDDSELIAGIKNLLFGKWISAGETCARFEKEFSSHINQKHSFFCNSGSSANLLLIAACKEYFGWKDGDEIIVSSVGFPTTVSAIVQNGLKPVFVDIEWDTLNFDLNKLEEIYYSKIPFNNSRVVAVFLSPVLGNPPNIDRLQEFCRETHVELLLDNCDSLGSKWNGKFLNEYAVVSSCSFYPAHEICTLEGGMVSSNVKEIVDLARSYGSWGRSCYCIGTANLLSNGTCGCRFSNWIKNLPNTTIDHKYIYERMGWNLKGLDICAAIGLEQLKKLEWICRKRILNHQYIRQLFKQYTNVSFPKVFEQSLWVPFGVPIICKNKEEKDRLVKYLEYNKIQTRNYFSGNLLVHEGYKHLGNWEEYPESNKVLDLVFFVGCAPTIQDRHLKWIEEVLSKYEKRN